MQRQFTIVFILILWCVSNQFANGADTDARQILAQSEEFLNQAKSFTVSYHAQKNHVAEVPEVELLGSLTLQTGNRFHLTNKGEWYIFDGLVEYVSDGTNYLGIVPSSFDSDHLSISIEWERYTVPSDMNKTLVKGLVLGGVTTIFMSQLEAILQREDDDNRSRRPFPTLTNCLQITGERFIGNENLGGKELKHLEFTLHLGPDEPLKTDLWLDEKTLLPAKRILHDKRTGDISETYTFDLHPRLNRDTFDPRKEIQSRKLEAVISQMELPNPSLLKACRQGNLRLATDALARGANPNAKASREHNRAPLLTALMLAADAGNPALIKLLVDHGADVNAVAPSGATPLEFACMAGGPIESVSYLIDHGASLTNAQGSLCWAAWKGRLDIVTLLLQKGVPVNQRSRELGTPLQRAIAGGSVEIARLLIKHGATVEWTLYSTILSEIPSATKLDMLKLFIENGSDVNARGSDGDTPLMEAALRNDAASAALLLEKGADPQLENNHGRTAMDMVADNLQNKEITDLFVKSGLMKPAEPATQKH